MLILTSEIRLLDEFLGFLMKVSTGDSRGGWGWGEGVGVGGGGGGGYRRPHS